MFKKILIANRGEIACRIIRTCRALGVKAVGVYSEVDVNAQHVLLADEAFLLGPALAKESYLNIEKIIEVAKKTGAEAIHPGYGFLSENAEFAEACQKAGLVFIGPSPKAICLMGDKAKAKALMAKVGVPLLPGAYGVPEKELKKAAQKVGYPVLIKAAHGGGGKGMRVVKKEADFANALEAAKREAQASFGNDEVMIEKYLEWPRHVEVQILVAGGEEPLTLFDRDCSLQRRHQKVIEEAPALGLSAALREKMAQAAIKAAKAVDYLGVGTVEFLVEGEHFYFMEMNTRLQVEHTVTEEVTGMDLVRCQLEVAAKMPTHHWQVPPAAQGHAIEVRLYAEDPAQNFMPCVGHVQHCAFLPQFSEDGQLPKKVPYRVDTGITTGDDIRHYYDPLLAKIIVHGKDRTEALARVESVLKKVQIVGLKTNLAYLKNALKLPAFQKGKMHTKLLEKEHQALTAPAVITPEEIALGALYLAQQRTQRAAVCSDEDGQTPWHDASRWRLGPAQPENFVFEEGATTLEYTQINGQKVWYAQDVGFIESMDEKGFFKVNTPTGQRCGKGIKSGQEVYLFLEDGQVALHLPTSVFVEEDVALGAGLKAPLPGKVVKVFVKAGQKVIKGDDLVLVEAMKTEHHITAPKAGVIKTVYFKVGDGVEKDALLVDFTPEEEA